MYNRDIFVASMNKFEKECTNDSDFIESTRLN